MNNKGNIFFFGVFIILFGGHFCWAIDQDEIQLHGFVSQGYLKSSDNNYLGKTKDGSFEFNEIGINFSVPINENLRFGIQLFSRDIGDVGNNELIVDWAFLDYCWRDWLRFRAGKMKMPYGLYNKQRDADMLRTFVLLPQSVYAESERDKVIGFQGASVYGSTSLSMAGDLDYEGFVGTNNVDMPRNIQGDILVSSLKGGMLAWNTPLPGLMFKTTFLKVKGTTTLIATDPSSTPPTVFTDYGDFKVNSMSVWSTEYEISDVTLAAEFFQLDVENDMALTGKVSDKREGWYLSASWWVNDWLELGAYHGRYDEKTFESNPRNAIYPDLDYYSYQKDTAMCVRYNLTSYWSVKLEVHIMEGVNQCELIPASVGIMEKDWLLYAAKTSLSF